MKSVNRAEALIKHLELASETGLFEMGLKVNISDKHLLPLASSPDLESSECRIFSVFDFACGNIIGSGVKVVKELLIAAKCIAHPL